MKYYVPDKWLNDPEDDEDYDPPHLKRFRKNFGELLGQLAKDQSKMFAKMMLEARLCGVMDAFAAFYLSDGSFDARVHNAMETLEIDPKDVAEYCRYIIETDDEEED